MRLVQNGITNNFGMVGKSIRKYLATTALTATGLMAIATPALADNWTDHVASEGSISIDTQTPNTTNITQHTNMVKVSGDGDINSGWTVNVAQPSNNSKYILYDVENDPTQIMGNLNANGKVYIFDQNGVIFGEGSQVNVGGIVTSTGHITDANIKADKHMFENVGGDGEIVNNGNITVAEGGLAAFVAPAVRNNGVINAKAGSVAMASGNKVTLDLYGDDLVNIAVEGELENAIVENKGTIQASGGTVGITVAAAKNAVDSVVNMDGIVDVSSVTVKGGKIIVNGGSKGTVNVAGKMDASGTKGGKVDVKGQNINVASTSETKVSGNDAKVDFIAKDHMDFRGSILAKGADVEVSGYGSLGFTGLVDAKTLLLDPTWAVIHSGIMNNPLGLGYVLSAQALANSMQYGTQITVQADEFIDVGTRNTAYNTGNAAIDAILNTLIGTGDIDLSTYNYDQLEVVGSTTIGPCPFCINIPLLGLVNYTGTTLGSIKFDTNTVNFNKNLKMGDGSVEVDATNVNLFARLYDKVGNLLGDARIASNAGTVNVKNTNASIQQGVWLAHDAGGATVEVGDGTYNENVTINKSLKLLSKNGRGATTIDGVQAGNELGTVFVTGGTNNVQIGDIGKGFTIKGVNGNGAIERAGVYLQGNQDGTKVIGNEIVARGDAGLSSEWSAFVSNLTIDSNIFSGQVFEGANPSGVGSSTQFVVGNNVPRQLVVIGGGGNTSNVTFTNNVLNGKTGGISTDDGVTPQGNYLATIDSNGATITGNTFEGMNTRGASLRARGTNTLISSNTFKDTNLSGGAYHVEVRNTIYGPGSQAGIMDIWDNNTFVGRATVSDNDMDANFDYIFLGIQNSVDISNSGANVYVNGGATYNESVLVNKSLYLHGANAGKAGNDPTRGPESIVDPNSPGFHVTADNVTIDGFLITGATGSDGYGVWVDNADNVRVRNNIINNVSQSGVFSEDSNGTIVARNEIDNTGSHGVLVSGGSDVRVRGNDIGLNGGAFNINGDGIQINNSDGARIRDNNIANTTRTVDNIGSGVHSISSDDVIITGNKTQNTDWDGVRVNGGNNVRVRGNDIDDAERTGVYLGQTTNSLAVNNDIDTTGRYGVNLDRGSNVTARGNTIDNTGLDGIRAFNNTTVTIARNVIGQSGGASNVQNHGILVDQSRNATVNANIIGNTVRDGIHAVGVTNAQISDNDLDVIGEEGIELLNSSGPLGITGNKVDKTRKHGIRVTNSDNTQVKANFVGLDSAASKIKGDAIRIEESDGVVVSGNETTNTASPHSNHGNGVQSINSNDIVISGNKIYSTAWDGVRVENGNNVKVAGNDIDNVVRTGIYAQNTYNSTYAGNLIDTTGHWGIQIDRGNNIDVANNDIDSTTYDGILIRKASSVTVRSNDIGTDAGAFNIKGSGIFAEDSSNISILRNTIRNTGDDGIHAVRITNARINGNNLDVIGEEGIELLDSTGDLRIARNEVDGTDKHGIRVTNSDNTKVRYNLVGLNSAANKINGDAIRIENSDGARVRFNRTTNTASPHNNHGNGVQSIGSDNVIVSDNEIWNTAWDGVRVDGGNNVKVTRNDIEDVTRSGIYAVDTNNSVYSNNTIDNAGHWGIQINKGSNNLVKGNDIDTAGYDGIYGLNGFQLRVVDNDITAAGNDGIHISGGSYADIRDNTVYGKTGAFFSIGANGAGRDGIHVSDNYGVEITGNQIVGGDGAFLGIGGAGAGRNGIFVWNSDLASITGNRVAAGNSGFLGLGGAGANDDGIDVWNTFGADIAFNEISGVLDDGIQLVGGLFTDIFGNQVGLTGEDGITVWFSDFTNVALNLIGLTGDDGIDVRYSGNSNIFANLVFATSGDGIQARNSDDLNIGLNIVGAAGDDGIDVENSDDVNIFANYVLSANNSGVEVSGSDDVYVGYNLLTGNATGFFAQDDNNGAIEVSGNVFRDNLTGAHFQSGIIDLTGPGNAFYNGNVGMHFEVNPADPTKLSLVRAAGAGHTYDGTGYDTFPSVPFNPTNFGGTIGSQYFEGQSTNFVYVDDGSFTDPVSGDAIWLDGSDSSYVFGGTTFTPSVDGFDAAQQAFLESMFYHRVDAAGRGMFFFYPVDVTSVDPLIDPSQIFNRFGAFNGDITGLSVQILSLPSVGGGAPVNPAALNQIGPFAGNETSPESLNQIETAAGTEDQPSPQQLNEVETASGGEEQSCWGTAVAAAGAGQVVNVVYGGSVTDSLETAATCGTSF